MVRSFIQSTGFRILLGVSYGLGFRARWVQGDRATVQSNQHCHQYRSDCIGGQKGKRERQDGLTKEYLFGVLKGGRGNNRLRGERVPQAGDRAAVDSRAW